jgi:hypothetical protein
VTWVTVWAVVIAVLLVLWFWPLVRHRRPPSGVTRPHDTEGHPSEASVRSGELGRGPGYWAGTGGGWGLNP